MAVLPDHAVVSNSACIKSPSSVYASIIAVVEQQVNPQDNQTRESAAKKFLSTLSQSNSKRRRVQRRRRFSW